MANIQQTTREYVLRARTEGVAETTAATQRLGVSQDALAVSVATQSKSSLSAAAALERHQRSLDQAYRASQQFATVQRDLERAQQQGLISSARQAELMAIASNRYQQGSTTSKALEKSLSGVSGQLIALSAGAGPVGVFLSALGPWGVAAAVGIGGLAAAFSAVKEGAERMGEKAIEMRKFMEITGLTAVQIKSLKVAGAELGVGGEEVANAIQRLTFGFSDARRASGTLFEDIRRVDAGLADQLRGSTTTAEGIDALARAYKAAGDEASKAAITRAAFGRGGAAFGPALGAIADAGGLDAMSSKTKGLVVITKEETEELAKMKAKIDELRKSTAGIWDSLAAKETLQLLLQYEERMNGIAKAAKALADQTEGLNAFQKIARDITQFMSGDKDPNSNLNKGWAAIARQKPQGQISQDFSDLSKQEPVVDSLAVGMEKLAAKYRLVLDPAAAVADSLTKARDAAAGDAKVERERIGVLGSAATIDEQRRARILDVNSALLDNKVNQQDANRAISAANLDAVIQAESRRVGLLGNLASVNEHVKLQQDQINKARMEGVRISSQEAADILTRARIQAEQAKPENQVAFEREMLGLTQEEAAIRQKLIGWGIDFNSARGQALTQEMRINDQLKIAKELTQSFAIDLLHGIMSGKSATDALAASLKTVGQSMADIGAKSLTSSLFKGFSGGGFSFDPVSLGIGAAGGLLSLASSLFDNKAKKAHDEAIEAWHQMASEFHRLVNDLSGLKIGSLQQSFDDATAKAQSIYGAALKAGDTGAMQQIADALVKFHEAESQKFFNAFEGTITRLNSGLGPDSPFAEGADRVKKFSDTVQGFLSDTIMSLGGGGTDAARRAADASAKYLLTLLDTAPVLSDTQQELQRMQGGANELQSALVTLGMSAEDAASAIADKLSKAMDNLRTKFSDDLQRQINDASGKGFLNDFTDLFTKIAQMQNDAATLGVGTGQIGTLFQLSAQKIVDGAQLTGQAFDDLIIQFPQLSGVVHEFTGALARSAADIASAKQSFQDQLFTALQDQNTVGGALAVFDLQAQRARQEEVARGGQALVDLEALQAVQRLQIQQRFADQAIAEAQRAADEQKRILQEAQDFVAGIARRITDYLNNFLSGSQSPLSPAARLAQAQGAFSTQLGLAQTAGPGQRDALNAITQYHQDLVAASQGYYGSSAAGQSIVSGATAQLQALPSQISAEQFIVNAIDSQTTSVVASTDLVRTALSAILTTGNPTAIAAALLPQFNTLDTNVNGLLSQSEFVSGLHGMASDSQLATMFKTLDTDNSGSISRLELIKTATGSTVTSVDTTKTAVDQTKAVITATNALLDATLNGSQALAGIFNNTSGNPGGMLNYLNSMNSIESLMAARLEYIHFNTASANIHNDTPSQARGGLVRGPGTGTSDSIYAGGAWVSNGEYVVNAADTARNLGALRAINDNHAVIGGGSSGDVASELRAIRTILMTGFDGLASVSSDGNEAIATRLDRANEIAGDANKRMRRDNAKTG